MSEPLTRERSTEAITLALRLGYPVRLTAEQSAEIAARVDTLTAALDTLRRELAEERERGARLVEAAREESDAVSAFLTAWGAQDVAETDAAFDAMYDTNPRLRAALDATGEAT